MGVEKLDELLKRMPDIAKAVNAFASETVQQQAYRSLLAAFGESVRAEDNAEGEGEETDDQSLATPPRRAQRVAKKKAAPLDNDNKPAKRRPVSAPSINKALNLRPSGEASLKDFATEKAPGDNTDRSVVAVHYLTHTLGSSTVSSDDIFTCYREIGGSSQPTSGTTCRSLPAVKGGSTRRTWMPSASPRRASTGSSRICRSRPSDPLP